MAGLNPHCPPDVLAGIQHSEDAGVYRLSAGMALVQTLDFLTPMVDDPRNFGRIAAANALSDVYAMGAKPLTAMNIVCFPAQDLPEEVLKEVLAGGLEKIEEAGAVLIGGHSVEDPEFKYGLSVTGFVHPDKMVINGGAKPGDALILTKAIGTGVLTTAIKGKLVPEETVSFMLRSMASLNGMAADIFCDFSVHAMTDITGFGLAGHALEMARASSCHLEITASHIPLLPGVEEYAAMGLIPGGAYRNLEFCGCQLVFAKGISRALQDLTVDPQTSGGLLAAVDEGLADACLDALHNSGVPAVLIGRVGRGRGGGEVHFR